jgi:hypothetical protein
LQEDIERRTVALSVNTTKLTGRALATAFSTALRKIHEEQRASRVPKGKQSVKKLMNHCVSTNSLELSGETKLFDRVARKYNVDYAFHKIGPGKYLLFFKAGQADAITAAFSEYTKRVMAKARDNRPSILKQLRKSVDNERQRPRVQERKRETAHEDR